MNFKVIETKSTAETQNKIQSFTKSGFSVVSKKKNDKGGYTVTFKVNPKKKDPLAGIKLAAWIVGLVELIACAVAMVSAIVLIALGAAFQNNDFCQKIIQEMAKSTPAQKLPTVQQLNSLGMAMLIGGSVTFGLCGIALIPNIWTVAQVKTNMSRGKLLGFALVGFICLAGIATGVLLCVVRAKLKANPKQSK